MPLPSMERDGAEELWLTRPFTPRGCRRRFTTGCGARALGGETREAASEGKALRQSSDVWGTA